MVFKKSAFGMPEGGVNKTFLYALAFILLFLLLTWIIWWFFDLKIREIKPASNQTYNYQQSFVHNNTKFPPVEFRSANFLVTNYII